MLEEFIPLARAFCMLRKLKRRRNRGGAHAAYGVATTAWSKLGTGWFGEAWEHVDFPGLVLKISGPSGWANANLKQGFRPEHQDAWPVFARHCLHYKHKHLPNVMHFEQVSRGVCFGVMPLYDEDGGGNKYGFMRTCEAYLGGDSPPDWCLPLYQMRSGLNLNVDVHEGNVMYCKENMCWVLTDPFSYTLPSMYN